MGMKMTFVELTYMGWKDKEKKELFLEGEGGDYEIQVEK